MTREKDQLTNTQDAGTFTQSGNHAAGGPANDTTQVNRAPNINPGASKQSGPIGNSGGTDMTQQSIGGSGAQDGISGTPSGTQGGESGQGINQGGQSQQSAQGHTQHGQSVPGQSGSLGSQGGLRNDPRTQLDPQESNRDRYGAQQSGATSGEVGDGRSQQQVAHGGSQASQHSKGRDDGSAPGAGTAQRGTGGSQQLGNQQSSSPGGSGGMADKLEGGPGNQQSANSKGGPGQNGLSQMKEQQQQGGPGSGQSSAGKNQAVPDNRSDNEQSDRQLGMQGSPGEPGHDIDDIGNKQSGGSGSRGGSEDQR